LIDTGDRVIQRGDRFVFLGRDGGAINVGGIKVYPEEVERVINTLEGVEMVSVRAQPNSFVGMVVTAQI
jgi:acyl-CoA synthetase (AMP-forming)/AMP-acid ligase II